MKNFLSNKIISSVETTNSAMTFNRLKLFSNHKILFLLLSLTLFASVEIQAGNSENGKSGASPTVRRNQTKQNTLWRETSDKNAIKEGRSAIAPEKIRVFTVNREMLADVLESAPRELTDAARNTPITLEIPTPDGTLERFRIEESPMLAPEVAAQFPTWKQYSGQGIDDPTLTARFDVNDLGFHAYVIGSKGTFLIDPSSQTDQKNYIVYYKGAVGSSNRENFSCGLRGGLTINEGFSLSALPQSFTNGTNLRTLRLAVSATKEYTNFFGGNVNTAFAAIQTSVNRMNLIYRRELAVSFTLVSDTRTVFTNSNTGGFPDATVSNVSDLSIAQNPKTLNAAYGVMAYDIGHAVSRTPNPNGLASSPSICSNDAPATDPSATYKGQGFTGAPVPQGDGYDVDYLAHEIGHQFGMSHTFNNDIDGSCDTRSLTSAYEPASGITIMGYGGICAPRNLAQNSIEFFNLRSFDQAIAEIASQPAGTCGTVAANGNTAPTFAAQPGTFTIPKLTPFTLTASATDANGDALTYLWEEFDLNANGATGSVPKTTAPTDQNPNPIRNNTAADTDEDGIIRPIFRAYNATTNPSRTFPALNYILNNANIVPLTYTGTLPNAPTSGSTNGYVCAPTETCVTGERLPSIARTMNFRVTARDNRAGGGGVADAAASVVVNAAAGPFVVNTQNTATAWAGGSTQTIAWDVAGTNANGINAANVNILLSTDGGQTFPIRLSQNTPNDGSETLTIPNIGTTTARIKIEAVGNIFFDINNVNFTINATTATRAPFDFDGDGRTDVAVFRPSTGDWFVDRSSAGFSAVRFGVSADLIVPADYDGDGRTDYAVFRPSEGIWYRINSQNNTFTAVRFGLSGDLPRPADFDGDGKADINLFRPSNGTWYRLNSIDGQFAANPFGQSGDVPAAADYDGDGKADLAVFRPSANTWYIARATGVPAQNFDSVIFGQAGDIPVPANYDGDSKTDIAVFRPSNGTWYRINSSTGQFFAVQFGQNGDIPVAGDYDGDRKADITVFRPSNGSWYSTNSQSGAPFIAFGNASDKPVPAAFNNQ